MHGVVEGRRIGIARQARGSALADIDDEYAVFFRAEYRSVLRTAFLIVRDSQRAEDVAQEAFLQLYRALADRSQDTSAPTPGSGE